MATELRTAAVAGSGAQARPVILVGFQAQGNLGLGYLSSTLRRAGYCVELLDIELPPDDIVAAIRRADPILVGFSLIFQFYIRRYGDLIRTLRAHGVDCHFTMGGHYPSLSSRQTLTTVPELDSVVRFEGEITLLEMVAALAEGRDWTGIPGLIHRRGGDIVANAARPLVEDLDSLPYPERSFAPEIVLGHKALPILASRGCARTCSFCSIHTFYRTAPGKVVRTRRPAEVVQEMQLLHRERGITIFLFQDDDFPLFGKKWRAWAHAFVDELHRSGLVGRMIWKISCRADAVDAELFVRMRDAGLYIVYMGLESGTEEGLVTLNKGITVAQNRLAVQTLKQLGIMFEFGFMLLDPSSTFESVHGNVAFLRDIVGDGSAAATFCKMLPYDGTPIKDALEQSGRLKGDVCAPDYDFLDPRLDAFYQALARIVDVTGWIHGHRALTPQLNWAWNELAVIRQLFPRLPDTDAYEAALRNLTRESNDLLFTVVENVATIFATGKGCEPDPQALRRQCDMALSRLLHERNAFMARHQTVLLRALQQAAA
ncbi:B12-binding domain-containing radical SAM protein [Limobrevibacterium gyesilva]|uniref:B12-binding domain-containing radical SAM protein n=1 Tax=Limobrevibacterium gyesilva TaxID=2991712 RepID=A0AA41YJH2_9PROT|nr:radical SAM protein [Limobrevibacterium gyesilva]MCW3473411.1 B12-binding domain-containing radical SAM protein [Limobrevibacterium gyesilva]